MESVGELMKGSSASRSPIFRKNESTCRSLHLLLILILIFRLICISLLFLGINLPSLVSRDLLLDSAATLLALELGRLSLQRLGLPLLRVFVGRLEGWVFSDCSVSGSV